nr:hypothetical protein CFP56_67022 [Quercus suber]
MRRTFSVLQVNVASVEDRSSWHESVQHRNELQFESAVEKTLQRFRSVGQASKRPSSRPREPVDRYLKELFGCFEALVLLQSSLSTHTYRLLRVRTQHVQDGDTARYNCRSFIWQTWNRSALYPCNVPIFSHVDRKDNLIDTCPAVSRPLPIGIRAFESEGLT